MGIPTILAYPMPAADDLPVNTAGWRPRRGRAALLVHDMQRYFVQTFPAGEPPVTALLANVARLCRAAAAYGLPVIYTAQPGGLSRQRRGLLFDLWGPGMSSAGQHREIVPEVAPVPGDIVLEKLRYSAFPGSDLAGILARCGRDQLIVCGVYAHIGCLMTVCDAFSRDIEAFLVADAVADFGPAEHRLALEYAARRCAVALTTDDLLAHLAEPAGPSAAGSTRSEGGDARRGALGPGVGAQQGGGAVAAGGEAGQEVEHRLEDGGGQRRRG